MRVGFGEPQGCARSLDSPRPDNDIFSLDEIRTIYLVTFATINSIHVISQTTKCIHTPTSQGVLLSVEGTFVNRIYTKETTVIKYVLQHDVTCEVYPNKLVIRFYATQIHIV